MSQFNEAHQEAFGTDAPVGGHPDDGNGFYADKLSYHDWYVFNNWQRSHMNFLETFAPVAAMTLITAINQPMWACVSIYVLCAGRVAYTIGYRTGGPGGRLVGAILVDIALLSVLVGGFYSVFSWDTSRILPISAEKFAAVAQAQAAAN